MKNSQQGHFDVKLEEVKDKLAQSCPKNWKRFKNYWKNRKKHTFKKLINVAIELKICSEEG